MRNLCRAQRVAHGEEHGARVPQRGLDIGVLAVGHLVQELIDIERRSVGDGVDPGLQLDGQLPEDVQRFTARDAFGQCLQGRVHGQFRFLAAQASSRPADYRDDLLVVHVPPPLVRSAG
jgi:hypothetical protein